MNAPRGSVLAILLEAAGLEDLEGLGIKKLGMLHSIISFFKCGSHTSPKF